MMRLRRLPFIQVVLLSCGGYESDLEEGLVDESAAVGSGGGSAPACGDANRDGRVTSVDASLILQAVGGATSLLSAQRRAADVDCSGTVTSIDAQRVLQSAAYGPSLPTICCSSACPTGAMLGKALDLFGEINAERRAHDLSSLRPHGCVIRAAEIRSDEMARNGIFSHTRPNGEDWYTVLDDNDVSRGWAGENLARNNYSDGESVGVAIRDLMNSPPHVENILSDQYTHLGVAMTDDGQGMKYYTMLFIGPP